MEKINNLDTSAIDFLLYSYFGIKNEKDMDEEDVAIKCARRAYLDLCRTIKFNNELKNNKGLEEKRGKYTKDKFCNIICAEIISNIKNILLLKDNKEFDTKHKEICECIMSKADLIEFKAKNGQFKKVLSEKLTYGQVQKWVNMTLKYLLLLGVWEKELKRLEDKLHIPVDSFVMEAANKDNSLKIDIPYKNKSGKGKYSENISMPWSQWGYDEYDKFQKAFPKKYSRVDWEGENWIKIAQERTIIEQEKLVAYAKNNEFKVKINE